MGSTYVCLHVHVVFSTRERRALIAPSWRPELHRYLAGTLLGLNVAAPSVGGTVDHVHMLFGMRASQALSDVVREAKKASSAWVRSNYLASFAWQKGYGAFSVGVNSLAAVRQYIEQQEHHHKRRDFFDEWQEMLTKHGLQGDE